MTTFNVYARESVSDPKTTLATGLTDQNYSVSGIQRGKYYLFSVGAESNGIEKVSDETLLPFGRAWTPDDLSAQLYLDADDITGSAFTNWIDRKTGGSYILAGASSSPQVASLNNHKCLRFNNNAALRTTSTVILDLIKNATSASVFIVWNKRSLDTIDVDGVLFRYAFSANQNRFTSYSNVAAANIFGHGVRLSTAKNFNSIISSPTLVALNKYYMSANSFNMSDLKLRMHIDGSLFKETIISDSGSMSNEAAISTIGGYTNVSTNAFSGSGHKGDIACIVFKNSEFTADERQKLEGWAAHKYGLASNLPEDHPYKSLVPVL